MKCLACLWMLPAAVLALGAAGGCSKEPESADLAAGLPGGVPRVALVYKATTNPFFQAMEKGAVEEAAKLGVRLEVQGIASETDVDRQAEIIRIMLGKGVQAIVIAPASSIGIVTPLVEAQKEGVKIINIDNRIDPDEAKKRGLEVATFIGPDNFTGARIVAEHACGLIKAKLAAGRTGKVFILNGITGVANAGARKAGFEAAVKNAGLVLAGSNSAEWDTAKAQGATESFLNNNPDVQGILCANDKMALGAIAAAKSLGRLADLVIVGYDNIDLARDAIRRGEMQATIEQNPAMMGALGVENAVKAIRGEAVPAEVPVPVQLITADDVKAADATTP